MLQVLKRTSIITIQLLYHFLLHLCIDLCSLHPSFWQSVSQKYARPRQAPVVVEVRERVSAKPLSWKSKNDEDPHLRTFSTDQPIRS